MFLFPRARPTGLLAAGHVGAPSLRVLVNVDPAPHIQQMASREDDHSDLSQHAAAIAQWDSEGGASTLRRGNTGARVSNDVGSSWIAETTTDLKTDQAPGEDKKIMECLGAAVIMRWGTLPTKIQRELFQHATSLADLGETVPLRGRIARFLHNHKDDGDRADHAVPACDMMRRALPSD